MGELVDVLQTGANDVYVVRISEESPYVHRVSGKKKELLLPAIRECVLDVDMQERRMKVHLMAGLLDVDDTEEKQ